MRASDRQQYVGRGEVSIAGREWVETTNGKRCKKSRKKEKII